MEEAQLIPERIEFKTETGDKLMLAELPNGYVLYTDKNGNLDWRSDILPNVGIAIPYKTDTLTTIDFKTGRYSKDYEVKEKWIEQTEDYTFYQKSFGNKDKFRNYVGGKDVFTKEDSFTSYILSLHPQCRGKSYLIIRIQ